MTTAPTTPTTRPPAFTFHGTVSEDPAALLAAADGAVIVASRAALAGALARDAFSRAAAALTVEVRPDWATHEELVGRLREARSNRIVGIGDGSVLDAAKLAAFTVGSTSPARGYPQVALAPAGREPYRAVTAFAVVDRNDERPTTFDAALANADAFVINELNDIVDTRTSALVAADVAVMATESLLSRRSSGLPRSLAIAALDAVASWLDSAVSAEDEDPPNRDPARRPAPAPARAHLVVGSFLAAEAMMATRLGLAHAIASPLGTATGLTHDAINAILGPYIVERWGDEPAGLAAIARGLRVPPAATAVAGALGLLRSRAGLPASLRELGIPWSAVERALPTSARSSGLPVLPAPLAPGDLEAFARAAWSGEDADRREESNRAGT